jgi:outer membrane protein assembly factor BamD
MAESEAEEQSRQKIQFTDRTLGLVKHGPTVVEAVHVGEPTVDDPKRTLAPTVTKENIAMYNAAVNEGKPASEAAPVTATGANEPPRSDQPSQAPQMAAPAGTTGLGVSVLGAPNAAAGDANAVVKSVGPSNEAAPAAEAPATAPEQINDIKPGTAPATTTATADSKKKKAPKADLSDESSSKKKKKKGLSKLNPF